MMSPATRPYWSTGPDLTHWTRSQTWTRRVDSPADKAQGMSTFQFLDTLQLYLVRLGEGLFIGRVFVEGSM